MRTTSLTFIHLLFFSCINSQISFSNIETTLKTSESNNGTALSCSAPSFLIKFELNTKSVKLQGNFVIIDSQVIQITPLKVSGLKKSMSDLDTLEQRKLLTDYSKYELDYFKKDLHIEIRRPNNQWIGIKSRKWFIWYFRVGGPPVQDIKKTEIQLFASTIIDGKLLTINAPILTDGDFKKAGLIVNQMMESITNNSKN